MKLDPKRSFGAGRENAHDSDMFLWSREQARLLEEKRFDELDLINLIDEVRALGTSEKREIRNRLGVLLMHLLKWRYQAERRSPSWAVTIRDQRDELAELLDDNPSLRRYPDQAIDKAYTSARLKAAQETGLDLMAFPTDPPFTAAQALDPDFLPDAPDSRGARP